MLRIIKGEEPEFFTNFNKLRKSGETYDDWDEIDTDVKEQLFKHLLVDEQSEYCPYCERKILYVEPSGKKKYRIEHIYPRKGDDGAGYKEKTFEYQNLIVSCDGTWIGKEKTCDHAKAGKFDEGLFINPVEENPINFLKYSMDDGEISPVKENGEQDYHRANYTIDLLQLNAEPLKHARRGYIDLLIEKSSEADFLDVLNEWSNTRDFPSLTRNLIDIYSELL